MAVSSEEKRKHEKWRHPEIKSALVEETKAKCAYCEGYIEDVSFPHVEHIKPKSKFPELAHLWENLTIACAACNIAKGDYFFEEAQLLNPYKDDLEKFIYPVGPLIDWIAGVPRAEITVKKIDLNRSPLLISRAQRLSKVRELYERWAESSDPIRTVLEETLRHDAVEGEFSQTVIVFLRSKNFPV